MYDEVLVLRKLCASWVSCTIHRILWEGCMQNNHRTTTLSPSFKKHTVLRTSWIGSVSNSYNTPRVLLAVYRNTLYDVDCVCVSCPLLSQRWPMSLAGTLATHLTAPRSQRSLSTRPGKRCASPASEAMSCWGSLSSAVSLDTLHSGAACLLSAEVGTADTYSPVCVVHSTIVHSSSWWTIYLSVYFNICVLMFSISLQPPQWSLWMNAG